MLSIAKYDSFQVGRSEMTYAGYVKTIQFGTSPEGCIN